MKFENDFDESDSVTTKNKKIRKINEIKNSLKLSLNTVDNHVIKEEVDELWGREQIIITQGCQALF